LVGASLAGDLFIEAPFLATFGPIVSMQDALVWALPARPVTVPVVSGKVQVSVLGDFADLVLGEFDPERYSNDLPLLNI